MIVKLKELKMSPSNEKRRVHLQNRGLQDGADWLELILGEIKQYNDWVTRKNKSLEEKDDPSTDFYHEKYEDTLRKRMWL